MIERNTYLIDLSEDDLTVFKGINPLRRKGCHSFGEFIGFFEMRRDEGFSDGRRELIGELFLTHDALFGEPILILKIPGEFFSFGLFDSE